jgi:hypothetical protein
MSDFLTTTMEQINQRIEELRNLADEYEQLQVARQALLDAAGDTTGLSTGVTAPPVERQPPRKQRVAAQRRRKSSRTHTRPSARALAALQTIASHEDGIVTADLGRALGLRTPTYAYTLVEVLAQRRLIRRKGKRWVVTPAGQEALGEQDAPAEAELPTSGDIVG